MRRWLPVRRVHGLVALDWESGNRSVLVDHDLSGVIVGLTLGTRPPAIYRALVEATAFGARKIVETFEDAGVPVDDFVVAGGLLKNQFVMQIYADVLRRPLHLIGSDQGPALGSAIRAAVAAGAHPDVRAAAAAMGKLERDAYAPDASGRRLRRAVHALHAAARPLRPRRRRPHAPAAAAARRARQLSAVARLHGTGDVRLADEPVPEPGPDESLVHVEAVGLCGSDLHWFAEGGIGDAGSTARSCSATSSRAWSRAGRSTGAASRSTRRCLAGAARAASRATRTCARTSSSPATATATAACASSWAGRPRRCTCCRTSMDGAAGAMLEPLGVAIHSFDLGHVHLGADVAVVGCGPIGLLLIQVARAAGARVTLAVEPLRAPPRGGRTGGRRARRRPRGRPPPALDVDVAFEVAGTDEAVDLAMQAARPGARVVLAGIPDDDRTSFCASLARRKGLTHRDGRGG